MILAILVKCLSVHTFGLAFVFTDICVYRGIHCCTNSSSNTRNKSLSKGNGKNGTIVVYCPMCQKNEVDLCIFDRVGCLTDC